MVTFTVLLAVLVPVLCLICAVGVLAGRGLVSLKKGLAQVSYLQLGDFNKDFATNCSPLHEVCAQACHPCASQALVVGRQGFLGPVPRCDVRSETESPSGGRCLFVYFHSIFTDALKNVPLWTET